MAQLPSQSQILLPLLETLNEAGGKATPAHVYDALAQKLELPNWLRNLRSLAGKAGEINIWERRVRNARQQACAHGLIVSDPERRNHNLWQLTESGKKGLRNCKPGVIITVFTTDLGCALLAEAETAIKFVDDNSINLILTSPPYPLITQKAYGNKSSDSYIDWLTDLAAAWKQKLTPNGSLVLNLADVYTPGSPSISLYQERLLIKLCDDLGYSLAQKFYWENSSKMPAPAEWVCVRRIRTTSSVEQIYSLTKDPLAATANNKNILRPYSESMLNRIAAGGESASSQEPPSGFKLKEGAFSKNNGGSIPHNLLVAPHSQSNDTYKRLCRQHKLPIHPARYPQTLPTFFIKFLTEPNQIVYDPLAGSASTAEAAEQLGRSWLISERAFTYLQGDPAKGQAARSGCCCR